VPPGAEWLGWLDQESREAAFARAGVFAMPSISEGFPVALLEAMAHGLAIVSTSVGGIGEVLSDGVDAVMIEPADPAALARALADVAADAGLRERLGRAALARAERLAEDDVYSKLDAIYAGLAGE
jgi:glycosyltransferase involved in cell wall biosynthesis